MILFIVDQPITLNRDGIPLQFMPNTAYVTSIYDARQHQAAMGNMKVLDEEKVLATFDNLIELGASNRNEYRFLNSIQAPRTTTSEFRSLADQVKDFSKTRFRAAIINGLGTGIGDTIIGLTAMRVARQRLEDLGLELDLQAWLRFHVVKKLQPVYEHPRQTSLIRTLPADIKHLGSLDGYWDFSSMLSRPMYRQLPFVDFFLHTLGIDPATVAAEEKRNKIVLDQPAWQKVLPYLKQLGKPFVLLHHKTSSILKDLPIEVCQEIFEGIIARTDFDVASIVPLPIVHDRFHDLSKLSTSYQAMCAIISQAHGLLSADTSVYHIADAFDVPALVIFATTDPDLHIPYYPMIDGLLLDGARDSRLFGMIKRPRDQNIQPEINDLWRNFEASRAVDAFMNVMERQSKTSTS